MNVMEEIFEIRSWIEITAANLLKDLSP